MNKVSRLSLMAITLFRLLSAQPMPDGEHVKITGALHNDDWYTDLYGQNPAPFYRNPFTNPLRPPYPWRPNRAVFTTNDVLFPNTSSFNISIDSTAAPPLLSIVGDLPVNTPPKGDAPLSKLQATTASTGGHLSPGVYLVAISNSVSGPVSTHFITCVIPAGTSTNTIVISDVSWTAASPAISIYVSGNLGNAQTMRKTTGWAGSVNDSFGNPTTFTVTGFGGGAFNFADGPGLPDVKVNSILVQAKDIIHGGVWGAAPTSVGLSGGSKTATFAGASWTTNQWAGYVFSSYSTSVGPKNWSVLSNTGNKLTFASGGFGPIVGEPCVMRAAANHITASTIGDDNFVNFYGPSGLIPDAEKGNLIRIIAGTGAGQPPMPIASNTATVLTINGAWYVTPDSSSVWIIEAATWRYPSPSSTISNDGTGTLPFTGSIALINFTPGSLLVEAVTMDSNENWSIERYAPIREVYVPAGSINTADVIISY